MSKRKIACIVVGILLILLAIGFGAFYTIAQKKLSVSYLISQSKGPEVWNEEISPGEEYASYEIKAKKYKYSGSEYFDEIVEIDQNSGDSKQFAFRTSTGWNNMKNIEIGRIELPYADKNSTVKCSYNYRGNETWQPCSEKEFIKSFEKIFAIKYEKGKKYEELAQQIHDLQKDCEAEEVNYVACIQEYSKLDREATKALKELRNATIELK